ncbi:hypothetical protein HKX42_03860 [Salinisphaera sp. USBA-960]|nr:hypothetical protein [Salifodinibacter halophilus]
MGYFVGTNALVNKRMGAMINGQPYSSVWQLMSGLGAFAGWFCILPAAYFVSTAWGNDFWNGLGFCAAALGGSLLSGFFQVPGFNQLLCAGAIVVNVACVVAVYILT